MSSGDRKPSKPGDDDKLELAARPGRPRYEPPQPYRPVRPPGPSLWPWVLVALIIGGIFALRQQRVRDQLTALNVLPSRAPKPMVVMSTPSGATLKIDGTRVGETPWAGDNHWHGAGVPYELSAEGYVPLKGTFEGDRELTLDVTLKHR